MQSLDIQGYSYADRQGILPGLTASLADSGAWITDRHTVSPSTTELRFEIQLRSVLDLYISLMTAGLELTRSAHLAMTDLWTCYNNLDAAQTGSVICMRLEISFLEELTPHSLLTTGTGLA